MRVWSYVITTDRGSAPNYDGNAVTLTICKPRIRKAAQEGDLVIAFNGKPLARDPHSVRWAGIVKEILPLADYWHDPRFRMKRPGNSPTPDNIYRPVGQRLEQVSNTSHNEENIKTDLDGRNALIFARTWHCGDEAPHLPFDTLWVAANRRLEPLRDILAEDWEELLLWLDAHGQPVPPTKAGRSCRAQKTAKRRRSC